MNTLNKAAATLVWTAFAPGGGCTGEMAQVEGFTFDVVTCAGKSSLSVTPTSATGTRKALVAEGEATAAVLKGFAQDVYASRLLAQQEGLKQEILGLEEDQDAALTLAQRRNLLAAYVEGRVTLIGPPDTEVFPSTVAGFGKSGTRQWISLAGGFHVCYEGATPSLRYGDRELMAFLLGGTGHAYPEVTVGSWTGLKYQDLTAIVDAYILTL